MKTLKLAKTMFFAVFFTLFSLKSVQPNDFGTLKNYPLNSIVSPDQQKFVEANLHRIKDLFIQFQDCPI